MDPNALLDELRAALDAGDHAQGLDAKNIIRETVAEKFRNLDDWLSTGGFLPRAWDRDAVEVDLTSNAWGTHASLSALNGAISAGEAVSRKLRGDS